MWVVLPPGAAQASKTTSPGWMSRLGATSIELSSCIVYSPLTNADVPAKWPLGAMRPIGVKGLSFKSGNSGFKEASKAAGVIFVVLTRSEACAGTLMTFKMARVFGSPSCAVNFSTSHTGVLLSIDNRFTGSAIAAGSGKPVR